MAAGNWAGVEDTPFLSGAHIHGPLSEPSQATPESLMPSKMSSQEALGYTPAPHTELPLNTHPA